MAQYDMSKDVKVVSSLSPAARTSTAHGTGIDTEGYEGVGCYFFAGVVTDGTHTPVLEESDDNSTFSTVANSDIVEGAQLGNLTSGGGNGSNTLQVLTYLGSKRYVRWSSNVSGATTGALDAAWFVLGHARHRGGTTV